MPKFTVYISRPYLTWEGVEAADADTAIAQCKDLCADASFDCNDGPYSWLALEVEEAETTDEDVEYFLATKGRNHALSTR